MCFACTESVTISDNERLFNKLKIAKNNLRKTQEGSRLNNFMLLSSEKLVNQIFLNELKLVQKWATLKNEEY